jgi:type II secretory pathway pseudopilin PulG
MRLMVVTAIACLLATTAVALADNGNRQKIRFNARDQAAVLRRSDLRSGADWKEGAKKPDLMKTDPCPNYNPKRVLPCLRSTTTKGLPAGATVVSSKRLPFPHVAPYTAAFRLITDVHAPSGTVRLFVDLVLFGGGRTESSLTATAPYSTRVPVEAAEVRLATILAARVRA